MRRADRLFEIVQILRRSRQPISAYRIAEELETSKRTIYRDIAALMANHVPITGEAGMGYVLDSGFDMPPLMLTEDELDAAMLGANYVVSRGEPEIVRAAQSLIAKIEAILPSHLRPLVTTPTASVSPVAQPADPVSSGELRRAIRQGRKVALRYEASAEERTDRTVWPVLLGYRDHGRILAAWCELRQDFRYFRTDRMISATVLSDRFPETRAQLRSRWNKAMIKERERYSIDHQEMR
jgi:predicted DNA-binding transcriptional regulator YafY